MKEKNYKACCEGTEISLSYLHICCILTGNCRTTSENGGYVDFAGAQNGVECIFPMKLGEKIYNGCVPDDIGCPWCSTKGNVNECYYLKCHK